jgi:hypothetical protein
MYTLWIANKNYSSWSLRPWALMRVLDIAFEEQLRPFGDPCGDGRGFRGFSPTGKVPCLHDGATVVWDSLAIAEYLAERHPGVGPDRLTEVCQIPLVPGMGTAMPLAHPGSCTWGSVKSSCPSSPAPSRAFSTTLIATTIPPRTR